MSEIFPALLFSFLCIGTIALVLLGIGSVMIVHYLRNRQQKAASQDWLNVQGRVTAVSVEEGARSRIDEDTFYLAQVEYEYQVEGQRHTARQGVGRAHSWEAKARRVADLYPVGRQVLVYYNPENPQQARLASPPAAGSAWALILGVFFLLLGGCAGCSLLVSIASNLLM